MPTFGVVDFIMPLIESNIMSTCQRRRHLFAVPALKNFAKKIGLICHPLKNADSDLSKTAHGSRM